MQHEIILCPKCRNEKDFYVDDDGFCFYESKCQCDKLKAKNKKLDEALKLIGELINEGKLNYAK
jgi:hypothetical protein